mgnify:FL=1
MNKKFLNKLILFLVLLICLFSFVLIGCEGNNNSETEIKTIEVGEVFAIDYDGSYTFSSSDTSVATVSKEGIVSGVGSGTCNITMLSQTKSYTISLTVNEKANNLKIKCECKQTISVGEEVEISPKVLNSTDTYIYTYSSSDTSVATVSDKGVVKGISSGIALITIQATGADTITDEVLIYVKASSDSSSLVNTIENKTIEVTGTFDLTYLNDKVKNIVNTYKESIVGVSNYQYVTSFYNRQLVEAGVGTGFIFKVEESGSNYKYYVLTNNHVVEDAVKLKIYFGYDDEYINCDLLASNSNLDLAVCTFTSSKEYNILPLGSVDQVHVGDFAIAIGNANGYEYFGSVTFGVISYVNRVLDGETAYFLQHDVAINPGNSGGPLFDLAGNVIGINTLKIVDEDVDNMGFAISIDTVKQYLKTLNLL